MQVCLLHRWIFTIPTVLFFLQSQMLEVSSAEQLLLSTSSSKRQWILQAMGLLTGCRVLLIRLRCSKWRPTRVLWKTRKIKWLIGMLYLPLLLILTFSRDPRLLIPPDCPWDKRILLNQVNSHLLLRAPRLQFKKQQRNPEYPKKNWIMSLKSWKKERRTEWKHWHAI